MKLLAPAGWRYPAAMAKQGKRGGGDHVGSIGLRHLFGIMMVGSNCWRSLVLVACCLTIANGALVRGDERAGRTERAGLGIADSGSADAEVAADARRRFLAGRPKLEESARAAGFLQEVSQMGQVLAAETGMRWWTHSEIRKALQAIDFFSAFDSAEHLLLGCRSESPVVAEASTKALEVTLTKIDPERRIALLPQMISLADKVQRSTTRESIGSGELVAADRELAARLAGLIEGMLEQLDKAYQNRLEVIGAREWLARRK